ncbi:DUF4331 family protein [Persicobacter psychrovividus]|uniref:DUF4331 domain-containing protein n=1 Tax=Persicobacter psychrovividus TaxID=387638 RepID=A0ABM7VHU3_9BACT|nr:hypothetical protein PEPS_25810 [Persicobacter psychrovividus]
MLKNRKIWLPAVLLCLMVGLWSADHIDAPLVGTLDGGSSLADITDYYAFESPENSDNYVFVGNVYGLIAPDNTADVSFSEDYLYEINLDYDGDAIEDAVIQVIFRGDKAIFIGPVAPSATGLDSEIMGSAPRVMVDVTKAGEEAKVMEENGIKVFAGPRDDPFFMDFFKFVAIVNGAGGAENPPTSFDRDGGADTFAGTNVMSMVIELPKSMLGGNETTKFTSWLESKSKK